MNFMDTIFTAVFICGIGIYLGWLFTENPKHALAVRFPYLNCKPFNCRPCMTFHLIWGMSACFSIYVCSVKTFVIGLLGAIVVFVVLYARDKNIVDD